MTVVPRDGVDVDERARLEEERDFLLTSLRDLELEREAGDIDELDHARLRDDYTARAAAVLRALEDHDVALMVTVEEARTRRDPRLVALVGAGVLAIAVLAGVLVASRARCPRRLRSTISRARDSSSASATTSTRSSCTTRC